MPLASGARFGPYQVLSKVGEGGMGEVYRAHDVNLDRDVALKAVLPDVAADPDRLARFSREARVLASLNHPNVAQVYGLEAAEGTRVLAMELVEGPTLADRIARGPLPIEEALPIARQIVDALEAAHEQGIVHRDLKPANIKVRDDGTVKVLDFGLAKASDPGSKDPGLHQDTANSPTMAAGATEMGMILGTAVYMAPEQARGKPVDKRADIWAFGVVLFEMLAGRPCFEGETVTDVLAAIVRSEPDWTALPAATPPRMRSLLARCLAKDRRQRLHDMGDVRIELSDGDAFGPAAAALPAARPPRWRSLVPWAIAALAVAASAGWALLGGRGGEVAPRRLALAVLPAPGTVSAGPIDLSADGRRLAFTAAGPDGQTRLYIRSLDAMEPRALPGTEDADAPFFSPDGRAVGFFAGKKLKRVDLAGGPPRELADAPDHRGGSWGPQNVIIFAPEAGGPIFRVSASGGSAAPVTELDPSVQEVSHRWPRFLPDGTQFLFLSRRPKSPRLVVEVGLLDKGRRQRLAEASSSGIYSGGRLYFMRGTTLLSQALDLRALALTGDPEPVVDDVWRNSNTDGLTALSVADDGTLAWRTGGFGKVQLTWLDRQGQRLGTVGEAGLIGSLDLSPEGQRVLTEIADSVRDTAALFAVENSTAGGTTRVSLGEGNQSSAIFSPDGRSVVFAWDLNGAFDLYRREFGTAGEPVPLVVNGAWKFPESWSSDGRFLSYAQSEPGKPADIWVLPMGGGDGKPLPFAQTPATESGSAFSPDGRFLAYASDEPGQTEIFVQTFPASGAKWQVSTGGGASPVWRRDGKELFYVTPDRRIVGVPVAVTARGLEPGSARTLFQNPQLRLPAGTKTIVFRVSADGQRFLVIISVGEAESSPILIRTGRPR